MKWRCYNRYFWFEIERNLSPPDAFYGIFYVQNPFAAPDPAGGAYSAPPDSLAGGEGASCPLPKNSTPTVCPSGLALRPFGPQAPKPENQTSPMGGWKSAGPTQIRLLRPY